MTAPLPVVRAARRARKRRLREDRERRAQEERAAAERARVEAEAAEATAGAEAEARAQAEAYAKEQELEMGREVRRIQRLAADVADPERLRAAAAWLRCVLLVAEETARAQWPEVEPEPAVVAVIALVVDGAARGRL